MTKLPRMDHNFTIRFETDSDGFLSRQCPRCDRRFKIPFAENGDRFLNYCPYCGREPDAEDDEWWTEEQWDYILRVSAQVAVSRTLREMLEQPEDGGGNVSVTVDDHLEEILQAPPEPEEDWPLVVFSCCRREVKHDGRRTKLHCPQCGREQQV